MDRFHCADLDAGLLGEAESRHCGRVLRHQAGDEVEVFDGRGRAWTARLVGEEGRRWRFEKIAQTTAPAPRTRLVLAQAIPKGKAMDLILQKATELGVGAIAPLQTERSVARIEPGDIEEKAAKWREAVVEAGKQCGQNWLPEVATARRPRDFFLSVPEGALKLVGSLQPDARPLKEALRDFLKDHPHPREAVVLIGPEGDLTPGEIDDARAHGFLPVSLGNLVLRCETAAFYLLSVLKYELD